MNKIKKLIKDNINEIKLKKIKNFIKKTQGNLGIIYISKFNNLKHKKKIFYMLTPQHGNLGDQAIAYASLKYLSDEFKEYEIIEIPFNDTYRYTKAIKHCINKDDLIFLHGGGNMGNHYIWEEEGRRHVINNFKENKIISFTQTIYFSDDENGKLEFEKTKEIYNSHNDLHIIAREDKSYKIMKENFKNVNIIKCPDIVFYLNDKLNKSEVNRLKITTCLRKDKETYVDLSEKSNFINELKSNYDNILVTDTIINENVYIRTREEALINIWNEFYNSKVVITDRLHGMIFCAITKTPGIVTRSLDHKVLESYKWIKDLNYIKVVENLSFQEIQPIIDEFMDMDNKMDFDFSDEHFNKLRDKVLI